MVGLLETKVNHSNEVMIMQAISRRWNFVINSLARKRIWLCWDSDVWDVVIVKEYPQFIYCSITNLRGNVSFFATFTYASNSFVERRILWQQLLGLASTIYGKPWVVLGDFNVSRSIEEILGGNRRTNQAIIDFNMFIDEAELDDLRFVGSMYSWSNKQLENPILKKLDRVLVNQDWISSFPNSGATFLSPLLSDHALHGVWTLRSSEAEISI